MSVDQSHSSSFDRPHRRLIVTVLLAVAAVILLWWWTTQRTSEFALLHEVTLWSDPRPDGSTACRYFPVAFASDDTFVAATDCDERIVLVDLSDGHLRTPFADGPGAANMA